jgi:hypothetical protein
LLFQKSGMARVRRDEEIETVDFGKIAGVEVMDLELLYSIAKRHRLTIDAETAGLLAHGAAVGIGVALGNHPDAIATNRAG